MRIAKNTKFFTNSSLGIANVFSTYLNLFFNQFSINLKCNETSIGHFMKIHYAIRNIYRLIFQFMKNIIILIFLFYKEKNIIVLCKRLI